MYDQMMQRFGALATAIESKLADRFKEIQMLVEYNQYRVMTAFKKHEVGDHHFTPSTGYGYDDIGRDTLEKLYATVFGTEAAIVRPQMISGTHAIATCLFGVLRPGDELLYITGKPYDTLDKVIGHADKGASTPGSLADFGITYQQVSLWPSGQIDEKAVHEALHNKTKMIGIQRSKGYACRPSFTIEQIKEIIHSIKKVLPDVIIFVDNCYGEFVEREEPTHVGADLMAGSLIKNPGGGIVKTGGYIVGRQDLIQLAGTRLAAPGIGLEGGASLYSLLEMFQGFFMAPHVVGEALKGAIFTSAILEAVGFQTQPLWHEYRTDLIQSVTFHDKETMIAFCQGIQKAAPVNAHVTPYPSEMPGYTDQVIMAAGTFIQGASIELSADGPIRPPFEAYVQGGLTYAHVKLGILTALNELIEKNLLQLNDFQRHS
jgi:cystathionine beta-lyase family protein involved in aluminum resistance